MDKLSIKTHNLHLTDTLEEYVTQKASKLDRYLPNIHTIDVDLSKQNSSRGADLAIAQVTLRHGRGAILRAEERVAIEDYNTIRVAVNGAVNKMHRRIERFKGKPKSKRVRERYRATIEELNIAEAIPDTVEEIVTEEQPEIEIVRRKEVSLAAMHEEEAVEQMELLGHDFFMFFNLNTNTICVLYKRDNGGYGVLVPDMN